jgi:hypothetical protein
MAATGEREAGTCRAKLAIAMTRLAQAASAKKKILKMPKRSH